LSDGELKALYARCDSGVWGLRCSAILALLYGGGLRCNEAVRASVEDYDLGRRVLRVVYGKGNKERLVPLNESAADDLEYWMYKSGWPITDRILVRLRSRSGEPPRDPLGSTGIQGSLHRLADLAGAERFAPHDLRRTMITGLLAGGVDVLVVGRIVGHQNPDTTLIYDRRPIDAQIAAAAHLFMPTKPKRGGGR
jgi:site-specific recombinase XerD